MGSRNENVELPEGYKNPVPVCFRCCCEPIIDERVGVVMNSNGDIEVSPDPEDDMKRDDEDPEENGFVLLQQAKSIWTSFSTYLSPTEAEELTEQTHNDLERMTTTELKDSVEAGKNFKAAMQEVVSEDDDGQQGAAGAQRTSIKIAANLISFDGEVFMSLLDKSMVGDDANSINAQKFLEAAGIIPLLMGGLGRSFEFATSDLLNKINLVSLRMKETALELDLSEGEVTLQQMVERDIENGTTHAGKKKAPASRNILRLLWFFDFVGALLHEVASCPDDTLKKICSRVYEETLAPRHIWILRKAARSGMGLLPKKEVFRKRLGTSDLSVDDEAQLLEQWAEKVNVVGEIMWTYMKSKGLEQLP